MTTKGLVLKRNRWILSVGLGLEFPNSLFLPKATRYPQWSEFGYGMVWKASRVASFVGNSSLDTRTKSICCDPRIWVSRDLPCLCWRTSTSPVSLTKESMPSGPDSFSFASINKMIASFCCCIV